MLIRYSICPSHSGNRLCCHVKDTNPCTEFHIINVRHITNLKDGAKPFAYSTHSKTKKRKSCRLPPSSNHHNFLFHKVSQWPTLCSNSTQEPSQGNTSSSLHKFEKSKPETPAIRKNCYENNVTPNFVASSYTTEVKERNKMNIIDSPGCHH